MEKKTDFKALTKKAKAQYIWDYYRWYIIISICVVAFLISMIVHYVTYKESILDVLMVNCERLYSEDTPGFDEFFEQEGFNPSKEEFSVDTSITYSEDDSYSTNYYSDQNLTLKLSVGGGDILFAPESIYTAYANSGSMALLTDVMTAEELEQYSDALVYATDSDTGETYPCGIILKNNSWLAENGYYSSDVCFGIAYNSDSPDTAKDFFYYILSFEN